MTVPIAFDWSLRPSRVREAAFRVVDGEAVVVLSNRAEIKVLNDVGARIWELCDGHSTLTEIADRIDEEFEGAGEELRSDVREFVESLLERGMLDPAGAQGS